MKTLFLTAAAVIGAASAAQATTFRNTNAEALSKAAASVLAGQHTTVRAALNAVTKNAATGGDARATAAGGKGVGVGLGGAGGSATAGGGAGGDARSNSGGNAQSVTVDGAEAPDLGERVPDVTAIPGNTTAPCYVGIGVGVGVAGFGGSIGGAVFDAGCDANRDALMLASIGEDAAAIRRLCDEADTRKALGARCDTVNYVAADDGGSGTSHFGMRDK